MNPQILASGFFLSSRYENQRNMDISPSSSLEGRDLGYCDEIWQKASSISTRSSPTTVYPHELNSFTSTSEEISRGMGGWPFLFHTAETSHFVCALSAYILRLANEAPQPPPPILTWPTISHTEHQPSQFCLPTWDVPLSCERTYHLYSGIRQDQSDRQPYNSAVIKMALRYVWLLRFCLLQCKWH